MPATGFKVDFLPDGSVKITIDGDVPTEIHDATEAALTDLVQRLGGAAKREALHAHQHAHGIRHSHGHIHH